MDTDTIGLIVVIVAVAAVLIAGKLRQRKLPASESSEER
jgi:hypothetical protein